ncbi:MAG: hypothetical protein LBP88_03480 [Treponema sp.]|jgi:hypothetical protein|nr:hypothetical protein [Treponema sp.]
MFIQRPDIVENLQHLCITAGSDFHGETRPDRKLGITAGNIKIDDAVLAAIPALGAGGAARQRAT